MRTVKPSPSIFVIDDDNDVREALQFLLESVFLPVITYENAIEFLKIHKETCVGCVIVDVRLPIMSGLELLEQLRLRKSNLSVIIITGHGDIPMAVKAIKNGAKDFLTKPFNEQNLIDLIHKLLKVNESIKQECLIGQFDKLTKREYEVMHLVVEGKLNKQIAIELNISKSTVELHRSRVMRKMNVKTVAELVKLNIV